MKRGIAMRTDDVKTFLRVVRVKTLDRCAQEMHVAQSTVSKRLQRLEENLGMRLLERHKGSRSVTLTRSGAAFVEIANRWVDVQEEVHRLHSVTGQLPLSIGTLGSMNMAFFTGIYRELLRQRPALRIKILQRHSDEMYTLVEKRVLSVGFTLLDLYNPSVYVRPCYKEPLVGIRYAASPTHKERTVRVENLDPEHELYMNWCDSLRVWHDQHWDPSAPGQVRADSVNVLFDLLHEPGQWAIFPYTLARSCLRRGDVEMFRLSPEPPERTCYAITHKYLSEDTRDALALFNACLMDHLTQELQGVGTLYPECIMGRDEASGERA